MIFYGYCPEDLHIVAWELFRAGADGRMYIRCEFIDPLSASVRDMGVDDYPVDGFKDDQGVGR